MSRSFVPLAPVPAELLVGRWRDFLRLAQISLVGSLRSIRRNPIERWTVIGLVTLLICVAVPVALTSTFALVLVLLGLLAIAVLFAVTVPMLIAISTIARLMGRRRVILMSPDRTAVLDLVVHAEYMTFANHARLRGSDAARNLRSAATAWAAANWPRPVRFRAQNTKIAGLYVRQFPQLAGSEKEAAFGRVKLEWKPETVSS